jgi:hypothetical protein
MVVELEVAGEGLENAYCRALIARMARAGWELNPKPPSRTAKGAARGSCAGFGSRAT